MGFRGSNRTSSAATITSPAAAIRGLAIVNRAECMVEATAVERCAGASSCFTPVPLPAVAKMAATMQQETTAKRRADRSGILPASAQRAEP
jgi:hypothetical protein